MTKTKELIPNEDSEKVILAGFKELIDLMISNNQRTSSLSLTNEKNGFEIVAEFKILEIKQN